MAKTGIKDELTSSLLDRYERPKGGAWFEAAVEAAEDRFRSMGAPAKRDEYWKFTDPTPLTGSQAALAASEPAAVIKHKSPATLVFVDGIYAEEISDTAEDAGVAIGFLSDASSADIHWAKGLYGSLEAEGHNPVNRPLAALNTARARDGVLLHVTGEVDRPVRIVYRSSGKTEELPVHHLVKLDAGAKITLIEETSGAGRSNSVIEVEVADGAAFHHVKVQADDHEVVRNSHLFARLGFQSALKSLTVSVNGIYARNEHVITFNGDDATATVAGAASGNGPTFHHDDTVFVIHDAVNCESRQVFKKVLRNGAVGVFQGKILVKPDAQKTDGYQISQGLLLDDDSQFLAKPELEIYADDVACSHGSTVGALDPTAIFYLTSRGIPKRQAIDMLVQAFLAEAIDEVEDLDLADELRGHLSDWMSRQA